MPPFSIKAFKWQGQTVLMRVDFNVPLQDGKIKNDERIKAALPSIQYLLKQGCPLILMSHLGSPKGQIKTELSLRPVAERLSELLQKPVQMAAESIGQAVEAKAKALRAGEILLLENLRFYPAEEKPETDPSFAQKLAALGTVYVNDAFGTCHRKHASTYAIAAFFPNKALMGFLIEKEIKYLDECLKNPKRPFCALIGGAKLSSKIGVLLGLLDKVDELFIGGAMAYAFFKQKGLSIGASLFEQGSEKTALKILQKAAKKKIPVHLPEDLVIAESFNNEAKTKIIPAQENIPDNYMGMDIGPKTVESWKRKLHSAKTIFWNGPLGVFEMENFSRGTKGLALAISAGSAVSIVGGGDSVAAIEALHLKEKFTHLSTGGGASLEYLENGSLPCIEVLTKRVC
ncbi:MAG: phosphoglycerate kinase [Parachlamydiales bacterium]|jgi:phosphoglycerate kinase